MDAERGLQALFMRNEEARTQEVGLPACRAAYEFRYLNPQTRHHAVLRVFLEFTTYPVWGYFPRYRCVRARGFCLIMPLVSPAVGLLLRLTAQQVCLLSHETKGGWSERRVWCARTCSVRGLVSKARGVFGARLLLTSLRAGTFCQPAGSSDVGDISSKTLLLTVLCFPLGKTFSERSHPYRLPRKQGGTSILSQAGLLDHLLLFGPAKNVLRWEMGAYHFGCPPKGSFSYSRHKHMNSLYFCHTCR